MLQLNTFVINEKEKLDTFLPKRKKLDANNTHKKIRIINIYDY